MSNTSSFHVLGNKVFRNIWISSIFANFGNLVLTVGAAWSMTTMSDDPAMVAFVQTAVFGPWLLFGLMAGTLADLFDRRTVILLALTFRILITLTLTILAMMHLLTPVSLLGFCFLFGVGSIAYAPAWQTSIAEQVAPDELPQAIALNSVSYNMARSTGPAIGGLIVATAGAFAAFATTVLSLLPVTLAFYFWKSPRAQHIIPREKFWTGVGANIQYIKHTPAIKSALLRGFVFGFIGGIFSAFAPLIAKNTLGGNANIYGLLLASFGVGAVIGALLAARFRGKYKPENIVFLMSLGCAAGALAVSIATSLAPVLVAFFLVGICYTCAMALVNISIQIRSPKWVNARALSAFHSLAAGGVAFGSWTWGVIAANFGISIALLLAAISFALSTLLRFSNPLAVIPARPEVPNDRTTFKFASSLLDPDEGPIIVEIQYRINAASQKEFVAQMKSIARLRYRNGAREWSLSQDLKDEALWTQRFSCTTWREYLHLRQRTSASEMDIIERLNALHHGSIPREIFIRKGVKVL